MNPLFSAGLFAALKGVLYSDLKAEIIQSLAELGLSEKLHQKVETLSSGQKRKLCVAIAFVCQSFHDVYFDLTLSIGPQSDRQFSCRVSR